MVAHYYTNPEVQRLCDDTGGHVSDSLDMARFGHEHPASTLLVAGVRFMGGPAKILEPREARPDAGPGSRVLTGPRVPSSGVRGLLRCPPRPHRGRLRQYQRGGQGALRLGGDVVECARGRGLSQRNRGEKILSAPDKYLGAYVQEKTEADMVLWDGACIVHEEFKARELEALRLLHPDAKVLVHPESPAAVVAQAISLARPLP